MRIFLYEPDDEIGKLLKSKLEQEGYDVTWIDTITIAEKLIDPQKYDASLIEIYGTKHFGLELIKDWFNHSSRPLCVSIYSKEDTSDGFHASKLGSQEIYELKHGSIDELDTILQRYMIRALMPQEFEHGSEIYRNAISELRSFINHDKPVLIVGEPGTGKSYLAEYVYNEQTQKNFRYEEIKCELLTSEDAPEKMLGVARGFRADIKRDRKGFLDNANERGLLYLEQIQQLSPVLQEIMAEVLEQKQFRMIGGKTYIPFTAHFIASCTNVDELRQSGFNKKLLTLLMPNLIEVPPLRSYPLDIVANAQKIIHDFCLSKGIKKEPELSDEAKIYIYTHTWPGNYRELKSSIEAAVIKAKEDPIMPQHISITLQENEEEPPSDLRGMLIFYLTKYHGNKTLVAKAINKSRPTLDDYLERFGIDYKLFKKSRKTPKKGRKGGK